MTGLSTVQRVLRAEWLVSPPRLLCLVFGFLLGGALFVSVFGTIDWRCESTSRHGTCRVVLNLLADALTAACSGDNRGRPTTGSKAAHCLSTNWCYFFVARARCLSAGLRH